MNSRPLLAALLAFLSALPLGAAERVALVIGNDAYPASVDPATQRLREVKLENCVNDATAVRDMLRDQLGFPAEGIIFGRDLTRTQIYQKLEAFKKAAAGSEMALVFYAGHGMESLDGRENFIIPVDADLVGAGESEALLRGTAVNLTEVLGYVTKATGGPKVVLLDCCRDRPAKRTATGKVAEGGGLAQLPEDQIPADTLILLAAAPNKQASDGRGHGPFTAALLANLPARGQNLLDAFFKVSDAVQEATGKQQIPWLKFDGSGTIFRQSALVTGNAPVVAPPGPVMNTAELAARDRQIEELKAQIAKMARESTGRADQAAELAVVKEQLTAIQEQIKSKPAVTMTPAAFPATQPSDQSNTSHTTYTTGLDRGAIGDSRSFEIGGGQKVVLKYVPGGEFLMGSPEGEQDRSDDEKQVRVTLTSHYWMGETEVTQGQWEAVMGSNPSKFKGATLPVEQVSHDDAVAFLGKLNAQSRPAAGWRWALPSEAQWERACRGGTETVFSFGDSLDSTQANFDGNYPYGNGKKGPNLEKTATVKSYAANGYGLYDMHGNVWEWCADWYGETLPGGMDPNGPKTGSNRVDRGGSWSSSGWDCRSADRGWITPGDRYYYLGFRLAAVPEER